MTDELLRPADVEAEYGICTGTLATWRGRGIGPIWQPLGPRRVVYRRSQVEAWVEAERLRGAAACSRPDQNTLMSAAPAGTPRVSAAADTPLSSASRGCPA